MRDLEKVGDTEVEGDRVGEGERLEVWVVEGDLVKVGRGEPVENSWEPVMVGEEDPPPR